MLFTPPNAVMCDGRRSRSRRRSGCGSKERQRAREKKRPREEKHHLVFSHGPPKSQTLSKNNTPTPRILLLIHTQQRGPSRRLKDIINTITRQTTALEILSRPNHLLH